MRRMLVCVVSLSALLVALPAFAKGSELRTSDPAKAAGDGLTLVAYVRLVGFDWEGVEWVATLVGPTAAYLPGSEVMVLGPVNVEETGLFGQLTHRVSITFTVPEGLEPGGYEVIVQGPDDNLLGDLIGGQISVGLGEANPQAGEYEWALDEPLVAELPDEAVIYSAEFRVTVGDLRAGRYPYNADDYLLDPTILDRPGIVIANGEPSTVPGDDAPDQTQSAPVAPPVREGPSVEPVVEGAGVDQDGSGMSSWWWPAGLGALALIGLVMVNRRHRDTAAESSQDPISARPAKSH